MNCIGLSWNLEFQVSCFLVIQETSDMHSDQISEVLAQDKQGCGQKNEKYISSDHFWKRIITIWFVITRMVLSYSSFIYRHWFNFLMTVCLTVKGWVESLKFLVSLLRVHSIVLVSIPGLPGFTGLQCTRSNVYTVYLTLHIVR